MSSGGGWTRLTVYVNGNAVAWRNDSTYEVKDSSTTFLYLGRDQATATSFKGIVDEFRLYKRALNQDGVKGLLWFLKGANNMLVPRGVFYDSKLYAKLNETALDPAAPFSGGTAYGNTNTLASYLNSRVIQLVIAKNLTLADAWRILDLARTNSTGVVTSFPFFATSEFYTLGFAWEVSKLAANTSVTNGGNWTAVPPPPPPPNLWDAAWNTIAGVAAYLWNAVVATAQFFINVGKWLVQAALAFVKGLTTGNWTDFQNIVLKPLIEALEKLIQWIFDLFNKAFSIILAPVIQAWKDYSSGVSRAATFMFTRRSCAPIECNAARAFQTFADTIMAPGFFYVVLALMIFLKVAGAWVATATAGLSSVAQKIGESIIPAIVGALFGLAVGYLASATSWIIEQIFFASVPETSSLWKEQRAIGVLSLFSLGVQWILSWPSMGFAAPVDAKAFILAVAGLALGWVALSFKGDELVMWFTAGTGLVLSVLGLLLASKKILKSHFADEGLVNAFEFVPPAITLVLFLMNVANFLSASARLLD